MNSLPKIDTIPIFEEVQKELILLLKSLSPEEWYYPTSSRLWNVKDVAAHLLDGDLRKLSIQRDQYEPPYPEKPIYDYHTLVNYLNELNQEWVVASKRLSPKMIIELIEFTTPKVIQYFKELDPYGTAMFSVGWAGEDVSENWFDIAREYTEKWHHQQQIREATGKPLLTEEKWLAPLLSTLIRGVPPVYNNYAKDIAETIQIIISGTVEYHWFLVPDKGVWKLFESIDETADTIIKMSDDTAWRLFTKNITEEESLKKIHIDGNQNLGSLIAKTVSFMK